MILVIARYEILYESRFGNRIPATQTPETVFLGQQNSPKKQVTSVRASEVTLTMDVKTSQCPLR